MAAYRLLSVRRHEEAIARRLDAPMIGREEDLAVLTDALDRATRSRTCRLVTVVAPAGTGKSRLLRELIERSGVTAIQGRCLSYGEG